MKLSEVSIKRPVFATMMIAALLVLGLFSYLELPVELWPSVEFPFVTVSTIYPGASPETVETDVTKEIEEVINEISGVRHIVSQSVEGYSLVFIEFELEINGATAAQDVRDKVSSIRGDLPEDIEDPIVSEYDPGAQPIMSITVSGRRPLREITELTKDEIKTRIESINGIGSVRLIGGHEREILVALDPYEMERHELTVNDVQHAIQSANLEIPGGRIDEAAQEYLVRIEGRLSSPDQFNKVIVTNHEGTPIYLEQIAKVSDTVAELRSSSTLNGNQAIGLDIIKQSGGNVVELAEEVRATLKQLEKELPPDIKISVVKDNSTWIKDSIHEILFNIRFGTFLAVLVIFLFLLDLRPTIITSLSIPISIIATFTVMRFLGFTVNFMTLMGLSLAVGILIDDSIVVVENIYRKIQEGQTPFQAAFSGTKEIGLAVSATTFAIMVVFLPVAFMEGIIGRFFYQFGMTVAFAVLISLFVAFTLVPMLASRTQAPSEDETSYDWRTARGWRRIWYRIRAILNIWNKGYDKLSPAYSRMLNYSIRHRLTVVIAAILATAMAVIIAGRLGVEWVPAADQGELFVSMETPSGTKLEDVVVRFAEAERTLKDGIGAITSSYITIGSGNNAVTEGSIYMKLTDADTRQLSSMQLGDSARILLSAIPGIKYSISTQESEGGSDKPIEMSVRGDNRTELIRLTHQVEKILHSIPGAIDIDNSLAEGKPELQITIDRDLANDLGINIGTLSQTVRTLIEGDEISRYKEGDKEYDVRLKLQDRYRQSESDLGRIKVASSKELDEFETFLVPIDRVAKIKKSSSIGEYNRYDQKPEVRVGANAATGYFAGTIAQSALAIIDSTLDMPPGYSIKPVGQEEMRSESSVNMAKALLLSIIFIYLLLASQYESFSDPFSIMLSLPLSLIGALSALWVFSSSLNIMSQIGIVLLMGLVTKNAILLVDFIKQRRREGMTRTEAILDAGPVRLRPILMTTLATVFGMLPLALGLGPGAEIRSSMARAVIGGMISSTLLTLIVVPVVYSLIDDLVIFLSGKRKNKKVSPPQPSVPTESPG